jgi:hypothetical protein
MNYRALCPKQIIKNKSGNYGLIHPYFTVTDITGFAIIIIALTVLTLKEPYFLRDPDLIYKISFGNFQYDITFHL